MISSDPINSWKLSIVAFLMLLLALYIRLGWLDDTSKLSSLWLPFIQLTEAWSLMSPGPPIFEKFIMTEWSFGILRARERASKQLLIAYTVFSFIIFSGDRFVRSYSYCQLFQHLNNYRIQQQFPFLHSIFFLLIFFRLVALCCFFFCIASGWGGEKRIKIPTRCKSSQSFSESSFGRHRRKIGVMCLFH